MTFTVFISHASSDKWVAGQIQKEILAAGAECFLDSHAIETGDPIDEKLRQGLTDASEFLVLLTPAALDRPSSGSRSGSRGARASGSSGFCTG